MYRNDENMKFRVKITILEWITKKSLMAFNNRTKIALHVILCFNIDLETDNDNTIISRKTVLEIKVVQCCIFNGNNQK